MHHFSLSHILPHLIDLAIAYILAVPIGWDRERSAKSAGLRTFPLVSIACCGFVVAPEHLNDDNLTRVVQGIVGGIGFIGAGAILRQGEAVTGTATAASVLATGAVGVAVGIGAYDVGVIISLLTFVTLRYLKRMNQ